jgi:DNA-binding XRE family transcriptional regulator
MCLLTISLGGATIQGGSKMTLKGFEKEFILKYKEIFAERLIALRQEERASLQQIGNVIGKTNQAISLLEKGKSLPSFEVLCQLADYFDVSIDYLVGRSDDSARR